MEETVIFEASSAEECVERMQRLLPLHRFSKRAVQVWGAEWRKLDRTGRLQEVLIPAYERDGESSFKVVAG